MIRLACFDLDGTLVSSLPEIAEGVRRLARAHGLPEPADEVVGVMIGGGVRVLIERLMKWWRAAGAPVDGFSEDALLRSLVEVWSEMDGSRISAYPGAFEGVRALRSAGVACWVVTNKEEPLARVFLEGRGLAGLFNGVIGAGGAERPKPAPDMIERAMREAGVAPAECVMVGDSRNDALAARAAGVRAMLVETGYNEGVPLAAWAAAEDFHEVQPDVAHVCAQLIRELKR
ncbi:HAD-IA family hydrolase [uncultured Sutterella sp.]|uniref:HAD family hydrolase n=1 Tax=uncultured Sutterella sp. TaxID=286133 RepID=UPI0025F7623C|nr:HAD-IA family hydrolase [uncultured Sutterella sp.]